MTISIAYLGPPGTYTETTALAYVNWLTQKTGQETSLCPYPNIAQTLRSVAQKQTELAVVPVENSIQGSVAITLDMLWELEHLQIQQALILPITHLLLSQASSLDDLQVVYSHPQALAQCQRWLESNLSSVQLISTNSTAEALKHLNQELTSAVIASPRAAELYKFPVLASSINDYPENHTRFLVLGLQPATEGTHISLAFTTSDCPGALVEPLQIFAQRQINLSRIESRPTKRSLGEYLFFIDLEGSLFQPEVKTALAQLPNYTEVLKIFGNYSILPIQSGVVRAS